jgi:MFS family permease
MTDREPLPPNGPGGLSGGDAKTTPPPILARAVATVPERRLEPHPSRRAANIAQALGRATGDAITSDRTRRTVRGAGRVSGELVVAGGRLTGSAIVGGVHGLSWVAHRFLPIDQPLLKDETFRNFWLSRLFVQLAQGAMLYALLILIVDLTSSSFYTALFVNCSILPAIVFGIPGGIVSDSLPRRPMMVGLNLARFALICTTLLVTPTLTAVFALTLALWVIHQFYSPIESTVVASLVSPEKFSSAQALHNLALTIAQAIGLVLLAPLTLRFFDISVLFAICASLFLAAAGFTALLPRLDDHLTRGATPPDSVNADPGVTHQPAKIGDRRPGSLASSFQWFLNGWRMVSHDRIALGAVLDDMLVGLGLASLLVIMPLYLAAVLNTAQENTTFVFAPAALGLVVGLRAAPALNAVFENRYIATAGLVLFALTVITLGFVRRMTDLVTGTLHLPLNQFSDVVGVSPFVLIVMLLSIPAGFASALVGVAARSVLLSRVQPGARGQVIASQNLLQSLATLLPTFAVGIFADVIGVRAMAIAIGLVLLIGASIAHLTFSASRPGPVIRRGQSPR